MEVPLSLTLLVENNPRIESFYNLNLTTWLGLEIIVQKNAESAFKCLEEMQFGFKLIIVRNSISKDLTAKKIVEFINRKGIKIPIIEFGPGQEVPGCFSRIPNSLEIKNLIQSSAKALNITAKDMSQKVVPDFFPISLTYFAAIKSASCSVYLLDIDNPGQYQLKYKRLAAIDEKEIKYLIESGVTELFIDKLDRLEFVNIVSCELVSQLDQKDLSQDEEVSATDKTIELLSKKLLSIGLNEETIKLSQKSMESIRKNVKSHPKLSKLLERMLANQTSYLFKHTQILTFVSLHIIKNIDWGNAEQEDKMSFIAFFHDIMLENDSQSQIKSTLELKNSSLTPEQKSLVEKHAQLAAEVVSKFPHSPMGADQIIRQHHGTLNGIGFSEHFGANVSPVAVVFIVSEEFARIVLKYESATFDRIEMLSELKEAFPTARFKKVIDTLQNITF